MSSSYRMDHAPSPKDIVAVNKMAQVKDYLLAAGYHPGKDVVVISGDSQVGRGFDALHPKPGCASDDPAMSPFPFPASLVKHLSVFQQAEQRWAKTPAYQALFSFAALYPAAFPKELSLERNPFGKPFWQLAHKDFDLGFSLSDSGTYWALAVGPKQLGIDVEQYKNIVDWPQLAQACFSPAELALLSPLVAPTTPEAFFKLWTQKEALLKWRGKEMPDHLPDWCTQTVASLQPNGTTQEMDASGKASLVLQFFSWMPQPQLFAALCLPQGPQRVFFFSILQA